MISIILSLCALFAVVWLWNKGRRPTNDSDTESRIKRLEAAEQRRTQHEIESRR